jgi:hypothetical protein
MIEEREDVCGLCAEPIKPEEETIEVDGHLVHRECYEKEKGR